ncbi:hypothetical protein ASPZODRAFT_74964 [Penicilliopsis zonata CBS 506.65]|uniref:Uncharacterized protein n=1 Tax=Penicilliopsis zonata CBS 506.65 TaxID=1073090 RepID=A0A1L9S7D9_9EURO|nr:hypothetical protein ASPZODRAFT_74964 [Penicilliopsis zonata CBS 506.65]OJJ43071.1 hypothetical protein ASPZODRAFT_74964 [Penicilliopsis zonata CBS 506.65]
MPSPQTVRRLILTGAVTSITIAGTLYGAGLKTNTEVAQTTQKRREATIESKLEVLRETRTTLVSKKDMVEKQLRDLEARIEDRKRKGVDAASKERPHEG